MNTAHIYEAYLRSKQVVIDSREVHPGDFFVALKGENADGNDFARAALDNRAAYVLADNPEKVPDDKRCLLVNDTLTTLAQLATMHRQKLDLPVLAITGTNGKTTTKELIAQVLAKKYIVKATKGNLNNHIGVPLTLLSFDESTEIGIVEMGANHEGEIAALGRIAQPNYGLITNIGKAHLEGFGSFEGVIKAKSELYKYLNDNDGVIFINSDNEILMRLLDEQEVVAYGEGNDNHYKGLLVQTEPYLVVQWRPNNPLVFMSDDWSDDNRRIHTNITGTYNFENIMAAIAVGADFGVPDEQIKHALEAWVPTDNRSQWIDTGKNKLLLDAYNANPTSMSAAISNFSRMQKKHKVLILGDMLELGPYAHIEHQKIVQKLFPEDYSDLFFVGPIFKKVAEEYGYKGFEDTASLIKYLRQNPVKNATVLIKASRGIRLEKVQEVL